MNDAVNKLLLSYYRSIPVSYITSTTSTSTFTDCCGSINWSYKPQKKQEIKRITEEELMNMLKE